MKNNHDKLVFTREDYTSFCTVERLVARAGVPANLLRRLILKELVDNALDASGECDVGSLPGGGYYVQNGGEGISPGALTRLFSINRPLETTKLLRLPSRGCLGNGLRVISGAVLSSNGELYVSTHGCRFQIIPTKTGESHLKDLGPAESGDGTRVEVFLGKDIPEDSDALEWVKVACLLAGGESSYTGKTSAWWYTPDAFFELMHSAGEGTVRAVITNFDGFSGKAGTVIQQFLNRKASSLNKTEILSLLEILRSHSEPVRPARLGRVGKLIGLPKAYVRKDKTLDNLTSTNGDLPMNIPVVVEVWAEPHSLMS